MIAKQLELVVEKIRRLPEERQAAAVEALELIAAQDDDPLTDAQIQGVKLAQQAVRAGEHASEEADPGCGFGSLQVHCAAPIATSGTCTPSRLTLCTK